MRGLRIAVLLLGVASAASAQDRVVALNREGNELARAGDFSRAIAKYSAAIELDSAYAEPFYNRGKAKLTLGLHREAIADFDRAIHLAPTNADGYNNRAIARKKTGDLRGALADYDSALQLDPALWHAYLNRGIARFESRQPAAACDDFRVAAARQVPGAASALEAARCPEPR